MKFLSNKYLKLFVFSVFLWSSTHSFSAIKFINQSNEPIVTRVTATAYDDLKRDAVLRYLVYIFSGKSAKAVGKKGQSFTLKTKKTRENYDMGYLLISAASADRSKQIFNALKKLAEDVGKVVAKLSSGVTTFSGFTEFNTDNVASGFTALQGVAEEGISVWPELKKQYEEIKSVSIRTKYTAGDVFLVVDRKKKDGKDELAEPAKYMKGGSKVYALDSYNKYFIVYVDRKIGAKLPRARKCDDSGTFFTLDKEGKDRSLLSRKTRKFGFTSKELFWCSGKRHLGAYNVRLFESVTGGVVATKDIFDAPYRYYLQIKLKNTGNKAATHRGRDILYLSSKCKATAATKKKDRCKEHFPKKGSYDKALLSFQGNKKVPDMTRFRALIEDAIKYKMNLNEKFKPRKIKTSQDFSGSASKKTTSLGNLILGEKAVKAKADEKKSADKKAADKKAADKKAADKLKMQSPNWYCEDNKKLVCKYKGQNIKNHRCDFNKRTQCPAEEVKKAKKKEASPATPSRKRRSSFDRGKKSDLKSIFKK